jgi:hypothetical protein
MTKRLLLPLLCLLFYAVSPVFGQDTQRAQGLPDGSVIVTPAQLLSINNSLTALEKNFETQKNLSGSLSLELETANTSLETLKNLSIEQSGLINNLKLQWTLVSERLQESDQSWVWMTEDLAGMETELARERANSARLERSARTWRTLFVIAGCLAAGAGIAAVVW